ncbi:DUF4123 domain-containing protein [Cupriavidus taiwanensis]|uniref:DUF4123 domain-containing protein n=1 Tax=Cupriavidus taiwanensis TaxID=164546 RepID=A0A7Z7NNP6_9BURK|nr:DUF4123 domain-containing protein [Cupriavidus taiwanensis]SOZ09716.1 conserved protein of unknown function [Cupriavidus taiwanensis]SOZ11835.1 conserved protein of unknown function [Cupriavidus taiwanensis]SOZ43190.1 conserved protein of unknown function [Cupriavidus taiwanensis]SPC22436.1 conserved protein of unknown function [Cupriavidus taiwanensis]SPD53944.1 conserved protein of unknown function [Cupriavidus taiwanensis]
MYFAVASRDPKTWLDGLLPRMDSTERFHWSALVDGAFDHGAGPFRTAIPRHALYGENGALRDLLSASPYLLPLDGLAGEERHAMLSALGKHCQGRPMLSFVASWEAPERLVQLWQPCLQPVVEGDDSRFLLRFADTRVLAALPVALGPAAWAQLTAPVAQWHIVSREGLVETLPLGCHRTQPAAHRSGPLKLSQDELDRMVDAAMPDALLDALYRQAPGILATTEPAQTHQLVAQAFALARQHRIEAMPDMLLLASYALATGEPGLRSPELRQRLRESRQSPDALREYLLAEA